MYCMHENYTRKGEQGDRNGCGDSTLGNKAPFGAGLRDRYSFLSSSRKDLENKETTRCDRVVRRMCDGYSNEPVGAKEPDRSTAETISTNNTTRKKKGI